MALRDFAGAELEAAIEGLGAHAGRLHAGVHRARKSIRRARAVLALGDTTLGPGAELLDHELRRLNRSLSSLRDAQALVGVLDRLLARPHDEPTARLLKRVRRAARAYRAACASEPGLAGELARTRALLATVRAALEGLPWDALSRVQVEEALAHSARRADSAGRRACADGGAEAWHRWRRRTRRMSQQYRACAMTGIGPAPSLFDKSLAEQLGVLQDLRLLHAHCGKDSPFSRADRAEVRRFAKAALSKQRERIASVVNG